MPLNDLNLDVSMDASTNKIINDFFIPCLSNSVRYDRAVGYFTSGWLNYAAPGMVRFANNGGHARWVTSPQLAETDWNALQRGTDARKNQILLDSLRQEITDLQRALERNTLAALAWMIADGILEFKLGVLRSGALFHAKFGTFTDEHGQQVSFNGSYNDSAQSNHNFESLSIFCSWQAGQSPYVEQNKTRFERIWRNEDENVYVFDLPEAAKQQILEFRTDSRPYASPSWVTEDSASSTITLWEHQEAALDTWESNNRVGLLNMATGSGKTITAIVGTNRCPNLALLVIAVPSTNLVEQWAGELQKHGQFEDPILIYGSWRDWQDQLFNKMRSRQRNGWNHPLVAIGTMQSLSGKRFSSVLEDGIPPNSLLIVDEVHNIGAPTYQKIMRDEYDWRLGLSATPERNFDEEGTAAIQNFFDKTVFTYSMKDALRDRRLTPYEYKVFFAELSEQEYEDYQQLTRRIIALQGNEEQASSQKSQSNEHDDEIEKLLFLRARILKKTSSKIDVVEQILSSFIPSRCLIYCSDNEQLQAVHEVLLKHHVQHQIYTAKTRKEERRSALQAIARGRIPVILAIDCLDEGVDVPVVDEAIIVASSSNSRQFIQRRGRILRKAPGKKIAQLLDVIVVPPLSVGNEGKHILRGELARARQMAELAENREEALLKIKRHTEQYGVLLAELLTGVDTDNG